MKKDIHPTYYHDAKVICACGNTFETGSVLKEIHVEICSHCHPFFTGEKRLIDSEGRVDKFIRRRETAKQAKAAKAAPKRPTPTLPPQPPAGTTKAKPAKKKPSPSFASLTSSTPTDTTRQTKKEG